MRVPLPVPPRERAPRGVLVAAGVWVALVCSGFTALSVYGNTPGRSGDAPSRWPGSPSLELAGDVPTLVMFAHPRCPCTRATLHELERLVAQVGGRLAVTVLFYRPTGVGPDWARTDLWRLAESVPRARVGEDVDGRLAAAFGAETSGHVVLYEPGGRLAFRGGITAARAHEGDNRGRDAIRHFVRRGATLEAEAPTFGCALVPLDPRVRPDADAGAPR